MIGIIGKDERFANVKPIQICRSYLCTKKLLRNDVRIDKNYLQIQYSH